MFRLLPLAAFALAAGCESFPTPAQLDHATVLAVVADPPVVAPGGTSKLSVFVADHGGPITPPTAWTVVPTYTGVAPMGTITAEADGGATYRAPDAVPALPPNVPPVDSAQVTVMSDPQIVAVKLVAVAAGVTAANPAITDVTVDGASGAAGVTVPVGGSAALAVVTDPAPDAHWTYAWYATMGEIKDYQSNPTTITGGAGAGDGFLFVVVRDGAGGAAVTQLPLAVR
jgi:hypothetical protein